MRLVAGVDSSTQSCKVVVLNAATGELVRHARASHPGGTEVDPYAWWAALRTVLEEADLTGVEALSIGGQQHGMVCLDSDGEVIRPALLWNDTRSAQATDQLIADLGGGDPAEGRRRWADAVGSVPVPSFTVTKLRWLADHEPDNAARIAAIALPHDWLTWKLLGSDLTTLVTDRSDASGTGYFDPVTNTYGRDLLALALRRTEADINHIILPRVLGPADSAGEARINGHRVLVGPGCGDNAGAALGMGLEPGHGVLSLGTSGVVAVVSDEPTHDSTGLVAGFADATGGFLPLACTLNGARILDATADVLDLTLADLDTLAATADPGAGGLTLVPYFEGERTPNLPNATATLHGMTLTSFTRANLARAAFEGLLCLMADALAAVTRHGIALEQLTLTGGGARAETVKALAPGILGVPIALAPDAEYVARGAARQAAWTANATPTPPQWPLEVAAAPHASQTDGVLTRYRTLRPWPAG